MEKKHVLVNWSGGKDCAMAVLKALRMPDTEIVGLLTSLSEEHKRVSMQGISEEVLEAQAEAMNLPLFKLWLPKEIGMSDYDALMEKALEPHLQNGVTHCLFGDIFLEDLRKYREEKLDEVGLKGLFPLWGNPTKELALSFEKQGFKANITSFRCIDDFGDLAGEPFNETFLSKLPDGIDPCGENGEFHSLVYEGPIFSKPLKIVKKEKVFRSYPNPLGGEDVKYAFQDYGLE
jgi:uncharacterized protein (TIGR00290 family)